MAQSQKVGFVSTATIYGVEALPVTVEISVGSGLPGFHIIGLPDQAIKEATQRVRQAIRVSGFQVKNALVVINLAPSSLRKVGSGFDLPIALAYLLATGQIEKSLVEGFICVGELSLDGAVRAVNGQLAYERLAQQAGKSLLTGLPDTFDSRNGISHMSGVIPEQLCLKSLADLRTKEFYTIETNWSEPSHRHLDFADIAGNDLAKRALQIAAAGGHGIMMVGPPGAGKSMLAKRLPSILPVLEDEKRLDSALIHSVAGLPYGHILAGERPFRAPHHSASRAGMIGGGSPVLPGEISLAHNGVLFLDELPEFGSAVLQLLRQPIETGSISLARAAGTVFFPAEFMLVTAANPCPCGYLSDDVRHCTCTPAQISRYQGRVGGPLIDRINLIVDISRSAASEVLATGHGTSSDELRQGVDRAVRFSFHRQLKSQNQQSNEAALLASCQLGRKEQAFLEAVSDRYCLSGRGIISTLAVARTIADMDEQPAVLQEHLIEAIGYRMRESQ
jgi:magnesium chelatase family protein